jgi:hypothetical protein
MNKLEDSTNISIIAKAAIITVKSDMIDEVQRRKTNPVW